MLPGLALLLSCVQGQGRQEEARGRSQERQESLEEAVLLLMAEVEGSRRRGGSEGVKERRDSVQSIGSRTGVGSDAEAGVGVGAGAGAGAGVNKERRDSVLSQGEEQGGVKARVGKLLQKPSMSSPFQKSSSPFWKK